jgi:hypothetical protein
LQERHFNKWICIIPNSQLVAIPYKPHEPLNWQLELYLSPSGLTLWVIVSMLSALLLLAIAVCAFEWREKWQDDRLKKDNEKVFSFSPL